MPKALLDVCGRPLLTWSLAALRQALTIVIVGPAGDLDAVRRSAAVGGGPEILVVPGGPSRAHSVALGLARVPATAALVIVHDAARPLIDATLVRDLLAALGDADGVIAAAPLADTPKRVDEEGLIQATPPREGLWLAQTPQVFRTDVLRRAVAAAEREGRLEAATDCASMVEAIGGRVRVHANPRPNLKVTTPADLQIVEALLRSAVR